MYLMLRSNSMKLTFVTCDVMHNYDVIKALNNKHVAHRYHNKKLM